MYIDATDFANLLEQGSETELAQAITIARDLDQIGVERDKALRIAAMAATHRFHDAPALPDYGDEAFD
jgi:hypothetical protein